MSIINILYELIGNYCLTKGDTSVIGGNFLVIIYLKAITSQFLQGSGEQKEILEYSAT